MSDTFISPQALFDHWQGHRRLSRRVIEAFPEDKLFSHSIGGMRPFGALAMEMVGMAAPMVRGIVTGNWDYVAPEAKTKAALLQLWDDGTAEMDRLWPSIPEAKFAETTTAFGTFTGPTYSHILYVIDNEIHHRGQGYVYLRSPGLTPPAFYER
jgi:uncharacterized damage-inducible protein DinB